MDKQKYKWIMIKRPHLYYPHIMCNGFNLVPIDDEMINLEIEKLERAGDAL